MPPDEQLIHDVVKLSAEGMKRRAIARALHISRNTVRDILEKHTAARQQGHSALRPRSPRVRSSALDVHRPKVEGLLGTYPDITAQRVFESCMRRRSFGVGTRESKTW